MNGRTALACCVTAMIVALAGCSSTVDSIEREEPIGSPDVVPDRRVETDRGLHQRVRVLSVRQTTVSGNLLKIEADVENTTNSPQRFVYMVEWFDDQGMKIGGPTGQWKPHNLQGRQRGTISAVAGSPQAVDFRLHLMRAR